MVQTCQGVAETSPILELAHSSPVVGVIKPISLILLFTEYFRLYKTHISYWISCLYFTGVSPAHISCGDTCEIWMWSKESNRYFCTIDYFTNGEINEQIFSNPHLSSGTI